MSFNDMAFCMCQNLNFNNYMKLHHRTDFQYTWFFFNFPATALAVAF